MAQTTFANSRGIAHKGSGGMSTVFPDVCKAPTPSGPTPTPFTNTGKSLYTVKGALTVKTDGEMPMVKGAEYMMTTGNEAGTALGVMSNMINGPAEFMVYSLDVKFEGRNVCRLGDPLFHNGRNVMG